METAITLHPQRDFLHPSNPSSPFAYMMAKPKYIYQYIKENVYWAYGRYGILIDDGVEEYFYIGETIDEIYNQLKKHF